MTVPPKFRKQKERSIATYDYIDVEEGAGIINYNATSLQVTTTTTYGMTRTNNFSDEVYTFVNSNNTGAAVEIFDMDFDITLQAPKNMAKGTANFILALGVGSGVTTEKSMFAKVTLKKNTTTIGAQTTSRTITRPDPTATSTPYSEMVNVPYTIPAIVHFAIGDVIRVNVEIWGTNAASTADFAMGHDPADRADPRTAEHIFDGDQSTKSTFSIPFRLEL